MNLLAHAILTLAGEGNDALLVGNLTADWIKGRARRGVPAGIQAGFLLHRHIDTFTDTHPVVGACAGRLGERWGRYVSILTDIFFDHLLASGWGRYSAEPLEGFTARAYATLQAYLGVLPEAAHFPIHALTADDWFSTYATLEGIRLTLTRISARLQSRGHSIELGPAADEFPEHRRHFETAFACFFPQLQRHVDSLEGLRAA